MLVGVFLYKESRSAVIYVTRSEEMLHKRCFDLTPLVTIYFQPQSQSKACSPGKGSVPLVTQGAQLPVNSCTAAVAG